MPRIVTESEIAAELPKGGRVLVQSGFGESQLIHDALMAAGDALGPMTFTGATLPGTNNNSYLTNPECRFETFFMTPALAKGGDQVTFLPLCYTDILARFQTIAIDAAIMMLSPPDAQGMCSFGPSVDFLSEVWERIPVRIAHINPAMPRTHGNAGIPYDALTAVIERDVPLGGPRDDSRDAVAEAIAGYIAPLVPNGATLQMGVGKVPGAVLRALKGHRELRVHSGLLVDEVVDLMEAGALADGASVVTGLALGSERLFAAIDDPRYQFHGVPVTHSVALISQIANFVSINSALEVDLLGQVYSEVGPKGLMSGPGGASDYARAARQSPGGLRIIALPASAAKGAISRIVAPGGGAGPVSLGRFDVDIIVTENGAADLRGLTYYARARALIGVAPEGHRATLESAWSAFSARL